MHTIKAVQTIADQQDSRFDTWFDALEYMKDEISKVDFDIALIGCGAYGMCLAAHVKRLGKQAVHLSYILKHQTMYQTLNLADQQSFVPLL